MENTTVKLLGLAPDAPPTLIGVLTSCSGVVPSLKGFKGAPSPASAGMATLAGTCMGAASVTKLDGTTRIFAGTTTKLYEAGSSTWGDVSQSATYTTAATGRWRFAQQENVSFATNGADTMQASVSLGAFSAIGGAPIANIVEVVGKFVFAANTSSATNQIRWSALGDYTSWAASISTEAGSDTLKDTPGGITAARRFGSEIAVFKKNSMYIGVYQGQPNIWEFNLVPGRAGALSQEVVVNIGTPDNPKLIFMGEDDFYVYASANPVPIGTNRVKESVFGSLSQVRYYACNALHDRKNTRVYFYYPTTDSAFPDSCVVYNYRTDTWGRDDRRIEATVDWTAPPITYAGASAVMTSSYAAGPNVSYALAFLGSTQTIPGVFDTTHSLMTLTGPATTTSFITGDIGDDFRFTTMTRVWPRFITAPSSATLTNYYKLTAGDSFTTDDTISMDSGKFDFIRDARWHRLQFNFSGDWEMGSFTPIWEVSGLE